MTVVWGKMTQKHWALLGRPVMMGRERRVEGRGQGMKRGGGGGGGRRETGRDREGVEDMDTERETERDTHRETEGEGVEQVLQEREADRQTETATQRESCNYKNC